MPLPTQTALATSLSDYRLHNPPFWVVWQPALNICSYPTLGNTLHMSLVLALYHIRWTATQVANNAEFERTREGGGGNGVPMVRGIST